MGISEQQNNEQNLIQCRSDFEGDWDSSYPNEDNLKGVTVITITNGKLTLNGRKNNTAGVLYSQWYNTLPNEDIPCIENGDRTIEFTYEEHFTDGSKKLGMMRLGYLSTEIQGHYLLNDEAGSWKNIRLKK